MISAAAEVQRRLWGTDPRAWADLAESHNRPLFKAVLDAAAVGPGTAVLDVGCGSGLTLVLAAERGAVPSGVDISPGLLAIARDRLPYADLREADMESLPFGDAAFDAVTGVNAFQFAGDPRRALHEAARVTRPGGRVVASLFAAPERSEGTVAHEAMTALIPPERADDHAPYALSAPATSKPSLRIRRPDPRRQRRGRLPLAVRGHGRGRPRPAVLRRRRPRQRGGRPSGGPRRPASRARPVPGPANRRRQPAEHVPLGRRPPATAITLTPPVTHSCPAPPGPYSCRPAFAGTT